MFKFNDLKVEDTSFSKAKDDGESTPMSADDLKFDDEEKPLVVKEAVPDVAIENRTEEVDTLVCGNIFASRGLAKILAEKNHLHRLRVDGKNSENGSNNIASEITSMSGTCKQETTASEKEFTSTGFLARFSEKHSANA